MTNIQSLSIITPPKKGEGCLNNCKFGVCFQCINKYENRIQNSKPELTISAWEDYINRLEIVRGQNTDTVIITGDIEPMGNEDFLSWFGFINKKVLSSPFKIIELQTAGNNLTENVLKWLKRTIGVTTISLSLSSFSNKLNAEITRNKTPIDIKATCELIKKFGINLRLSLNMNTEGFPLTQEEKEESERYAIFDSFTPHFKVISSVGKYYIENALYLDADQLTIRKLYQDESDSKPAKWVREYGYKFNDITAVEQYIKNNSNKLGILPYGAELYSYKGMSIAIDNDCMAKDSGKDIKYLVLGPDCKLYRDWEKTLYA